MESIFHAMLRDTSAECSDQQEHCTGADVSVIQLQRGTKKAPARPTTAQSCLQMRVGGPRRYRSGHTRPATSRSPIHLTPFRNYDYPSLPFIHTKQISKHTDSCQDFHKGTKTKARLFTMIRYFMQTASRKDKFKQSTESILLNFI